MSPTSTTTAPTPSRTPSLATVPAQFPNGVPNLNRPVLHHVDIIGGSVTGKVQPGTSQYTSITSDAAIKQTVLVSDMKDEGKGWKSFTFQFTPTTNCYLRLRGTNVPASTNNITDSQGNPLSDTLDKNITYTDPKLGPNTPLGYDVAAWSNLWFYSNPIFFRVATAPNF